MDNRPTLLMNPNLMKFQVQSIWINTPKLGQSIKAPKILWPILYNNCSEIHRTYINRRLFLESSEVWSKSGAPKRWASETRNRFLTSQKNLASPWFTMVNHTVFFIVCCGDLQVLPTIVSYNSLLKAFAKASQKSSERPPNGGCFHPKIIQRTWMKMMEHHSDAKRTQHPKHKRLRNLGQKEKLMEIFGGPST